MFLPKPVHELEAETIAANERKQALDRIERWSFEAIPSVLREGVQINVSEVKCGDPNCSPIDTAIVVLFSSGGRGMVGVPAEAKNVMKEDLEDVFPPEYILAKWHRGEEAEWPEFEDDFDEKFDDKLEKQMDEILSEQNEEQNDEEMDEVQYPQLRFEVGQLVQCRISPDPINGWADGQITQLWYREQGWPPNSWAPYKVQLYDGRKIFAPGDVDQIIRARNS